MQGALRIPNTALISSHYTYTHVTVCTCYLKVIIFCRYKMFADWHKNAKFCMRKQKFYQLVVFSTLQHFS